MIQIIGGSGFIGSRLVKLLTERDVEFTIIDRSVSDEFPDKTRIADVRKTSELQSELVESKVLINLAAEHRDDVSPKSLYWDVNVDGARNICQVADKKGISQIIFTSSVAVYGFAPENTGEDGAINPFNEYGKTKYQAELIFSEWQKKDPGKRSLVIIRPTVVFGEQNRGNVYNLLKQIAVGKFLMIGAGKNKKSMAYVGNVVSFIYYAMGLGAGVHIYNYIDKPDYSMNELISVVRAAMNKRSSVSVRLPYVIGLGLGYLADIGAIVSRKKIAVSSIRVRKFCATTMFKTSISENDFKPPFSLTEGLENTIKYEFLEDNEGKKVYFTE